MKPTPLKGKRKSTDNLGSSFDDANLFYVYKHKDIALAIEWLKEEIRKDWAITQTKGLKHQDKIIDKAFEDVIK